MLVTGPNVRACLDQTPHDRVLPTHHRTTQGRGMTSGITGFRAGVHVSTGSQKHLHDGQMPFPRCQNQRRHASFAPDIGVSAVSKTLAHLVDRWALILISSQI